MKPGKRTVGNTLFRALSAFFLMAGAATAAQAAASCYAAIDYVKPANEKSDRALYLLVDQTTPLSGEMRQRITALLSTWGKPGDAFKVAQFSANFKGKYPKIIHEGKIERMPDEAYLYQLRWADKKEVLACLEAQQKAGAEAFQMSVKEVLAGINTKTPKTELLYSLKELSKFIVDTDAAASHTLFLVSDGMENSGTVSFYAKGALRAINPRKEISNVRRKGLVGHWKSVDVYMYGLGLIEKDKVYTNPERVKNLRAFWEHYFVEGGARVKAIGTPELLVTTID